MSNRKRVESLSELLDRPAFDKQQNGVLGRLCLSSHLFVSCVNRLSIRLAGNDRSEQLSVLPESLHRILDKVWADRDDERVLALPLLYGKRIEDRVDGFLRFQ